MQRIESVDVFRVLAILSVIALHTAVHHGPYAVAGSGNARMLFNQAERFAVPFFFMVSGYLWAGKCPGRTEMWPRSVALSKRVLSIFFAWSMVYLVALLISAIGEHGVKETAHIALDGLARLRFNFATLRLLLVGPKDHLWFLPALVFAALITGAVLSRCTPKLLYGVAAALFLIGLAGGAYADSPLGFQIPFSFRNGPFFSLVTFATGYFLQRRPRGIPSVAWGAGFAFGGLCLQVFEVIYLHRQFGTYLSQDYTIGTYFFGLGVTILALSNAKYFRLSSIAAVGPLVLGIYTSHVMFIEALRPVDDLWRGNVVWDVGYVLIVFAISTAVTYVLSQMPLTKRFVS